jgi:hypothetical protein
MMFLRSLAVVAALCLLAGCKTPYKEKDTVEQKEKRGEQIRDQTGEQSFQAFLGRLRTAVAKRDQEMLTSLMSRSFGWRFDAPPPGETAFAYWDQNNLWPDLQTLLQQRPVPHETYMVVPAEFAAAPETFRGPRAGMRQENGSWKLAYFVTGEDVLP